jgi:integrase
MPSLTDKQLQDWLRQGAPIAGRSDGGGLTFTLSRTQCSLPLAKRSASWTLRYRVGGRQRELTLGNYPDMRLSVARKLARAERAKIDQGADVALAKRTARLQQASAMTFEELADGYLAFAGRQLRPKTMKELHRYLEKDLKPRLRGVAARSVTPELIVVIIEQIGKRSESVARNAFQHLNVIFAYGVARRAVISNPCAGLRVSAILGRPRTRRPRIALSEDELRIVLATLPHLGRDNELSIKILLATCVRKSELIKAKRPDVYLDLAAGTWYVPAENAKGGRPYTIPLAAPVVGWFRELVARADAGEYVLASRTRAGRLRGRPISERTLNAAIDRLAEAVPQLRRFSPHDLRSTARTRLAALGVDIVVAERCLNHHLGGLVPIYDKHDYLDERRRALNQWADLLMSLEPQSENVHALRAAA